MEEERIEKIYEILNNIPVTVDNFDTIQKIRESLLNQDYIGALKKLEILSKEQKNDNKVEESYKQEEEETGSIYPNKLSNIPLERTYMGLLLSDPKLIVKYYFLFEDCYFEDESILNIYKSVLFTEGGAYTPEIAKQGFNFSRDSEQVYKLKNQLKAEVANKTYNMEKIYLDLKKLFVLRKNYLAIPIKSIQDKVIEITDYILYDKMSVEEVESAIIQVNDTEKFKRAVLNRNLTSFLEMGDNNLRNGLSLPFPILTSVFKGIRKGETMAFAMPSTIINNPEIQKLHGYEISKTEGELLEFKFRADDPKKVDVDEKGFIIRKKDEKQGDFVKRLMKESTEFKNTVAITDWANKEIKNSIYFINITDHTNDELKKVIMNYYYKEQIEYVFYDTLKTDTANIGVPEEIKRTATILSNLAQNFNLYICSTLQLAESDTLPVNLDVNDLAVSRTVKEVLDTLCLIKQINRDTLKNYEYSLKEVDTKFYDLKKYDDPDVRYYACVVDKNRAGAKPTLVFRLNLAYNVWNELGYLRLKQ